MSKPAPPKNSFLQTALLITTLYLGYMIFFGNQNRTPDPRTAEQILVEMQKAQSELRDIDIAGLVGLYESKVAEEVKEKKLTEAQAEQLKLAAETMSADTKYKSGVQRNDSNKLNLAFMSLVGKHRSMAGKPEWTTPIAISLPKIDKTRAQFPYSQVSPSELYDKTVQALGERNKTDLVWGVIPGYQLINALVNLTGAVPAFSYAFAALLLAIVVRAIIWPVAQRQLMWSRQMSQLQPLVKELKDRYTGQELQLKTMELYKEYGINPMAGCVPALIQLPLFLTVYQCMLHFRFEFTKGTFLWINSSVASSTHGLTAPNLGEMDYPLLVIYGISMIVTTLLAPVSDPSNMKQQRYMGVGIAVFFTIVMFFWPLPSAFVLYWIFTNILSTIQSLRAYRLPLPPLKKLNTPDGGVYPLNGSNGHLNGSMFKGTGAPKVQKPKPKKKK